MNQDWRLDAACLGTDTDAFFPERITYAPDALAICHTCPVATECLQYALDANEREGIWGATTPEQRKAMRKKGAA